MIPSRTDRWRWLSGLSIILIAMLLSSCQAGTGVIVISSTSPTPTAPSTPSSEITTSNLTPAVDISTSVPATATETWVTFGPDWCTQGCLTLAEWNDLIPDGTLRGAMAIAYNADPAAWRQMARIAVVRRTRVFWAPLDASTFGEYRGFDNVILVNSDLQGQASSAFLASVLAHEVYHAATLQPWQSPAACAGGEAAASSWGAYTYQQVQRGSENPTLAAYLTDLLTAWQGNDLLQWIENSPAYQQECAAY
jgi:hypothetical protein